MQKHIKKHCESDSSFISDNVNKSSHRSGHKRSKSNYNEFMNFVQLNEMQIILTMCDEEQLFVREVINIM